jgi:para-nitrobenzyl esterase
VVTDAFFLYGSFELARIEHGYLYRFSRVAPANAKTGATHGNEVRYVFGDTHRDGYESLDHRLSDQMMTAWVHFAQTGDPRLMQSSDWTRIGANDETPYMDFGDTPTVKQLPYGSLRVFEELWPASGKASGCEIR